MFDATAANYVEKTAWKDKSCAHNFSLPFLNLNSLLVTHQLALFHEGVSDGGEISP